MIPPKPGRLPSASFPIRPKRPSRGGPFLFYLLGGNKSRLRQEFAFGKMLVRPCAAARSRSREAAALNSQHLARRQCCRRTPERTARAPGTPQFIFLGGSESRLRQGFASGKTLVRRGAAGRFRARGRCGTPGYRLRLAMNCFAVRGVRPGLRISHLTASARRLSRSKAIPACSAIPSTSSRNSAWFSAK